MVDSMKKVASLGHDLTVEERNLLSVAYKNVIGARRASWRVLSSIEQKEAERGSDGDINKAALVKAYKGKVEHELDTVCAEILKIIKDSLLPHAETAESKVFYYKMGGARLFFFVQARKSLTMPSNDDAKNNRRLPPLLGRVQGWCVLPCGPGELSELTTHV